MMNRSATRRVFNWLNLLFLATVGSLASFTVFAGQYESLSAFEVCEEIDDDAEQLACFRETFAGLKAGESAKELSDKAPAPTEPGSSRAQVKQPEAVVQEGRETVTQDAGLHEETIPVHAVEPPQEAGEAATEVAIDAARQESKEAQDLYATITAVRRTAFGKIVATLDNGQVWRETDGSYYRGDVGVGNSVVISKRRFGGYEMKIADQPGVVLVRRSD